MDFGVRWPSQFTSRVNLEVGWSGCLEITREGPCGVLWTVSGTEEAPNYCEFPFLSLSFQALKVRYGSEGKEAQTLPPGVESDGRQVR